MARTIKQGLDYFPLDVDFFTDEKIEFASARFGSKGELIAIKLLCKIYRNGYYTTWNDDDAIMFAKRVGEVTPALVNDVIVELVKRDFFDKGIFNSFKILTSRGIQRRYLEAAERRKSVTIEEAYLLIDTSKFINVHINPINVDINSKKGNIGTQRKGKERKEEESKVIGDESPPKKSFKEFTGDDFIRELEKFKDYYPKDLLNNFYKYWKEKSAGGKMRFQLEKTWETELRLEKWKNNQKNGTHQQTVNGSKQTGASQLLADIKNEFAARGKTNYGN
jgi:hypothetical protein